ncbi:MAG: hypothetical protein QME55_02375 [Brevundimonas sp.]|uniref:hypothetical protein n=1 Tax=Brevundimonas sp. TaxID=1871086 RepID=UPI0026025A5D|nr:hypothetical protein [Brevundimonas sp.]MDI6623550.1 hypothetical protein [Brevundimonas sp.]MDQ7813960.1 hypothetical protein [Brevundimonas sp.]
MEMTWAAEYAKEIVSVGAVILGFALNHFLRPRAKLVYSIGHAFTFLIDQPLLDQEGKQIAPKQSVNTASIIVKNEGVASATDVEVTFNWKPGVMNVWPARHYEEVNSASDRHTVKFCSLAPKESVGIELFAINAPLPGITAVRSEQSSGVAKDMAMMPVHSNTKLALFGALILLGAVAAIYLSITAIQWLARIPY